MKKGNILLLALGIVVLTLVGSTLTTYNSLVAKNESVATYWNSLQQQCQHRANLVPSLLQAVKCNLQAEKSSVAEVETAQAKVSQCDLNADRLTPENLKRFHEAQEELTLAVSKLLTNVQQNCPDLSTSEIFADLQLQLEETANRISECQQRYNQGVDYYNNKVRHFPASFVAPLFGFHKKTALNE